VNIPNLLTILRFIIIPIFGYFLYIESYYIAFYLFLLGGLTDILDGFIARKFNLITSFGKLADPLADKLMQITALILLTMQQRIPSEILIIVIAKEVFMGVGSILLYKKEHFVVSANWYGKLSTVVFFLAIILTLFDVKYGSINISSIAIAIALISNLFAFIMYSIAYRKIRNLPK
jgi:cardiolipin synthase